MKNQKGSNERIKDSENEIDAQKAELKKKEKPVDDAFKTANRKHKLEWREPQDEQMFDDFGKEDV